MEQFLKNFFNDNSVCVGLCDLKRKNEVKEFLFTEQAQPAVQTAQTVQTIAQPVYQQQFAQPEIRQPEVKPILKQTQNFTQKPQIKTQQVEIQKPVEMKNVEVKPQKQTLAQRFAAQQREYAAQQAFLAEQRKKHAQQQLQAQKSFIEQAKIAQQTQKLQQQAPQTQPTKPTNVQEKHEIEQPLFSVKRSFTIDGKTYFEYGSGKSHEPKVIVNGNMKKVVSAAVPARCR